VFHTSNRKETERYLNAEDTFDSMSRKDNNFESDDEDSDNMKSRKRKKKRKKRKSGRKTSPKPHGMSSSPWKRK
jgi:hypothetical protein